MDPSEIYRCTIEGNPARVKELTQQALAEGMAPGEVIHKHLIPAMAEVGDLFERQEFFLPEMLTSALAMREALAVLKPLLVASDDRALGRVVIGTVQGDMHDIGKNLVSMMAEGAGFEVVDLGTDQSPEDFVNAVKEYRPEILGLSALLSSTMKEMKNVIQALEDADLRQRVRVIVGGAPLSEEYAILIGADGYAPDASSAARKMKDLLSTRNRGMPS